MKFEKLKLGDAFTVFCTKEKVKFCIIKKFKKMNTKCMMWFIRTMKSTTLRHLIMTTTVLTWL